MVIACALTRDANAAAPFIFFTRSHKRRPTLPTAWSEDVWIVCVLVVILHTILFLGLGGCGPK